MDSLPPLSAHPAAFALCGFLFLLLRLGYHCFGLILCRHPLTAGIILWLITGDNNLLLAAVFFELFWLDLFHAGTYVPSDSLFAYLVFAPLPLYFNLPGTESFAFALPLCLPLAPLSARAERFLRQRQSSFYHQLNKAIDKDPPCLKNGSGENGKTAEDPASGRSPVSLAMENIILRGMCQVLLLGAGFYAVSALGVWAAAGLLLKNLTAACILSWCNWGFLLCLASLGGLMALRIPAAMACFIACVVVLGGFFVF
jgi:PTS system mannose-specific IIC component